MEDIAVHVLDEHAAQRGLHREYLIGAHDHQVGLALLDDEIVAQELGDRVLREEHAGELGERIDALVVLIGPVEDKRLEDAADPAPLVEIVLVRKVLGLHGVGHDEHLDELEQAEERFGPVPVDLVDGLVDLDARTLELDLHERQAVDENRHVVTVRLVDVLHVLLVHRHLMRDLIGVPLVIVREEFQIDGFAVIQIEDPLLTQDLRRLVDRVVEKPVLHTFELGTRQRRRALRLDELVPVDLAYLLPEVREQVVVVAHPDEPVSHVGELFGEMLLDGVFGFGLRHGIPSLPPITL